MLSNIMYAMHTSNEIKIRFVAPLCVYLSGPTHGVVPVGMDRITYLNPHTCHKF